MQCAGDNLEAEELGVSYGDQIDRDHCVGASPSLHRGVVLDDSLHLLDLL